MKSSEWIQVLLCGSGVNYILVAIGFLSRSLAEVVVTVSDRALSERNERPRDLQAGVWVHESCHGTAQYLRR